MLKKELRDRFEELNTDSVTLQAKYNNFCAAIDGEQRALNVKAKNLWTEVIDDFGLQGEWRYNNGTLYPVDEPGTK
jgi:hypothetical protein